MRAGAEGVSSAGGKRPRTRRAVSCWGRSGGGLGGGDLLGSNVPQAVLGIDDATAVANFSGGACALRASGQIVCWGFRPALGTTACAFAPSGIVTVVDLP